MEPDTLSPYSSVISTVCQSVYYLCGVRVRVCLCVFLVNLCVPMCVCVCKSQLESICTLSCLNPPSAHLPHDSVRLCVCHLVTLLLQSWWVPLVTVCGSVWSVFVVVGVHDLGSQLTKPSWSKSDSTPVSQSGDKIIHYVVFKEFKATTRNLHFVLILK